MEDISMLKLLLRIAILKRRRDQLIRKFDNKKVKNRAKNFKNFGKLNNLKSEIEENFKSNYKIDESTNSDILDTEIETEIEYKSSLRECSSFKSEYNVKEVNSSNLESEIEEDYEGFNNLQSEFSVEQINFSNLETAKKTRFIGFNNLQSEYYIEETFSDTIEERISLQGSNNFERDHFIHEIISYNGESDIEGSCESGIFNDTESNDKEKYLVGFSYDRKTKCIKRSLIPQDSQESVKLKEITKKFISKRAVCEICGKLLTIASMRFHINQHKNNYPYICPVEKCQKRFTSRPMLRQHMNFHNEQKRFTCDICGGKYYMFRSLHLHRLSHFDPTFECSVCKEKFHTKIKLRKHIRDMHSNTEILL